ncbi:hypothetical protein ACHAWF_003426 [Thalassiosira exigua]
MHENIVCFGYLYLTQISGTAMDIPCAPDRATLYQGLDK